MTEQELATYDAVMRADYIEAKRNKKAIYEAIEESKTGSVEPSLRLAKAFAAALNNMEPSVRDDVLNELRMPIDFTEFMLSEEVEE